MKWCVGFVTVVCWMSGDGVQVSTKSGNSSLIQTPSVANCMHRLVVTIAVGMTDCIDGWGRPRPPMNRMDTLMSPRKRLMALSIPDVDGMIA